MSEITPMMSQYLEIKEQYRDAVLFFRLGDFYEMFNQDAIEVSALLNLTLTKRGGSPMCGIPYHAARVYIARLLRAGKKIAICEQLSVPGPGKGLAVRKVVEVITPGTATDEDYLDFSANNYLAALALSSRGGERRFAFGYLDITTGEFAATSFPVSEAVPQLRRELGRIQSREMLIQQSILEEFPETAAVLNEYQSMVQNRYPDWHFNPAASFRKLCLHFNTSSLKAFALDESSPEILPAALLLEYVSQTSGPVIKHLAGLRLYTEHQFLSVDDSTRRNLELITNLRDGSASYTLFEVLNYTKTAPGVRLLRNWILHPLVDASQIQERLEAVDRLYRKQRQLSSVRDLLSSMLDIERLTGRVAMDRAHAKDLCALRQSLLLVASITPLAAEIGIAQPQNDVTESAATLADKLRRALCDECPTVITEGGMIRPQWSAKLDELRELRDNSNAVLEQYLAEERTRTGIQNLKIRYNRMLGYYLEVSKGNLDAVPAHFIRRRSLANGDRFTTDRLVELETELNNVQGSIEELERDLFLEIRSEVRDQTASLLTLSAYLARLDVLQSFAHAATVHAWNKPELNDSGLLEIRAGRHPVVEAHLPSGEFVPNSLLLSSTDTPEIPAFALITGPNMAGKSTFLRQTALITLMAQLGSFVPAERAVISPVDRLYCRVGATDNLARGESTFLVEMTETAHILRTATERSLVIMDEVGRGTSTGDGLSIAQAVSEFLLQRIGARTLFATHYHELTLLQHPRLVLLAMDVLEREGEVVFLKKVRPGASANSYGIHVARLAGIPDAVLQRSAQLLSEHQCAMQPLGGLPLLPVNAKEPHPKNTAPGLFSEEELVVDEILSCDPESITPLQALTLISTWKKRLFPV